MTRYTRQAERDLLDIWLYVAESSRSSADRVLDQIRNRCGRLSDYPRMGAPRPQVFPGARVVPINRWLAVYRIDDRGAQIVRVVDAVRDLGRLGWSLE